MNELTADNIQANHVYSAKNHRRNGHGEYNDRMVIWVSPTRLYVQYDASTLGFGRRYPRVTMEKFVKWAEADVTDATPKHGWRTEKVRPSK